MDDKDKMRVAVVGAAGRTGRQVVEQALARGHQVIAVARRPELVAARDERMLLAEADARDRQCLCAALAGADAIVSALGTATSRTAIDVYSASTSNELHAMRVHGIHKLTVVSAAPAGPRDEQRFLERGIAMPLLDRFFGRLYDDMRRMEELLHIRRRLGRPAPAPARRQACDRRLPDRHKATPTRQNAQLRRSRQRAPRLADQRQVLAHSRVRRRRGVQWPYAQSLRP